MTGMWSLLFTACLITHVAAFVAGLVVGHRDERRHRPLEPYEILAELRGPLGLGRP